MSGGLQSIKRLRERIMFYGPQGAGKSYAILSMIAASTGRAYIVDTDNAYDRLIDLEFPELADRVEVTFVEDWGEQVDALDWAFGKAEWDDFVVLDSTSDSWDDCKDFYTERFTGQSIEEFLASWREGMIAQGKKEAEKAKRQGVQGSLVEEGLYDYVNPAWNKIIGRRLKSSRCHVIVTAQSSALNPREDRAVADEFMSYGFKPKTNKRVAFDVATVLLVTKDKMGRRKVTTVKDWGRESMAVRDQEYEDMAWYLEEVAGWESAPETSTPKPAPAPPKPKPKPPMKPKPPTKEES